MGCTVQTMCGDFGCNQKFFSQALYSRCDRGRVNATLRVVVKSHRGVGSNKSTACRWPADTMGSAWRKDLHGLNSQPCTKWVSCAATDVPGVVWYGRMETPSNAFKATPESSIAAKQKRCLSSDATQWAQLFLFFRLSSTDFHLLFLGDRPSCVWSNKTRLLSSRCTSQC